ncbi:MAG: LytTR family DNA-binding domain-containing protein [Schleiferiaceae bacterium]|nr:LytTR family DNA-binding domain-containing protein [Schleiferiaceae bacterium]
MKAIIVDDERHARMALRGILEDKFPHVQILDEASNLPDAVKLIKGLSPDVVFLDISMPGHSGLEIMQFFEDAPMNFSLIFVTAHDDYALQAFDLSAVDYLLKPVRVDGLTRALEKIQVQEKAKFEILKHNLENPSHRKIALQTGEGTLFLLLDDIIYLKADGSYTHFHLADGRKLILSRGLSDFTKLETMGNFFRIHRSHLINANRIDRILKHDGGSVIMSNGDELSIAPNRKKELMEFLESDLL